MLVISDLANNKSQDPLVQLTFSGGEMRGS